MPRDDGKYVPRTLESIDDEYLGVQEKRVDMPIVDNKGCRTNLISRIEAVTLKIIKQISSGRLPCISYSRGNVAGFESREENGPECSSGSRTNTISFDDFSIDSVEERDAREREREETRKSSSGKTIVDFARKRSRKKFVMMMTMMAEIHSLLLKNATKTRRSFYYDLKESPLVKSISGQRYVDRTLNDVAELLDCTPWNLRLLATSKGLVAGNMTIALFDNQVLDCRTSGGALIPQIVSNVTSIRAKAKYVLVVEKDAIFQKLLDENCPRVLNCILVTGKGYPDVATRMLVKLLSEKMDLPVYIVVDADPFGVDIMLIYRFGSAVLRRGNDSLACPRARWLGIFPSELIFLGAKTIPLTEADLTKLKTIQARSCVNEAVSKQLSVLRSGKAEIEAVSAKNFLTMTYLPYKIEKRDYI